MLVTYLANYVFDRGNRITSIIQLGRKNCKIIEKQEKTTMQPRKSFGPKIAQRKGDTKSKDQSFYKNL